MTPPEAREHLHRTGYGSSQAWLELRVLEDGTWALTHVARWRSNPDQATRNTLLLSPELTGRLTERGLQTAVGHLVDIATRSWE